MTAPSARGHRKFSEIRREVPAERRTRIDAIKNRMEAAERLFEVRKELGITQAAVADSLGISQGNVSTLEHREDALISSVRAYIEALGGELVLIGRFGDRDLPVDLRDFATLDDQTASEMNATSPADMLERDEAAGAGVAAPA